MTLSDYVGGCCYRGCVKLVVPVKLLPSSEVREALCDELRGCNDGANYVSAVAFEHFGLKAREYALRKLVYAQLRERGIKSAAAQQLIKKVTDAYTTLRANIKAGNLTPEKSKRHRRAVSKPIAFRRDAAQPYDQRNMGWDIDAQTVAITTRMERMKGIPFVCTKSAKRLLKKRSRNVYKARRAGVPVVLVDPAYTSQMCAKCGHTDKCNRVDRSRFICRSCGVVAHADRNASHNIAQRGETVWNAGRQSRVPATRPQS